MEKKHFEMLSEKFLLNEFRVSRVENSKKKIKTRQ